MRIRWGGFEYARDSAGAYIANASGSALPDQPDHHCERHDCRQCHQPSEWSGTFTLSVGDETMSAERRAPADPAPAAALPTRTVHSVLRVAVLFPTAGSTNCISAPDHGLCFEYALANRASARDSRRPNETTRLFDRCYCCGGRNPIWSGAQRERAAARHRKDDDSGQSRRRLGSDRTGAWRLRCKARRR